MRVQLDRFEDEGFAVLLTYPEGERSFDMPREALPEGASPGEIFTVRFERDHDESRRMKLENQRLMDELLDRGEA